MTHSKSTTLSAIVCFLLVVVLALSGCTGPTNSADKQSKAVTNGPLSLTIAHISDTHSYVAAYNYMFEIAGGKILDTIGGYGLLMNAIQDLRKTEKNLLVLHAGDILEGTIWSMKFGGMPECDAMNAIGFDALTLGNHDFAKGPEEVANIVNKANFPVLAANMDVSREPLLAGKIKAYTIKEFDGQKIGIIGLITPDTEFLAYPGKNISFLSPEDTARRYISELNAQGINKIIVLSHLGYDADVKLAKSVSGIDIIVGGHSHTFMGGQEFEQLGLHPEMPYPVEIAGPTGDKVLIVHSWEYNRLLGVIKLNFDENGKIVSYSGQPFIYASTMFQVESEYGWDHLCPCRPEFASISQAIANNPGIKFYYDYPDIVRVLQPYLDQLSQDLSVVVAIANENLYRGFNSGPGPLIADAFLWDANKANPAVQLSLYDSYDIRSNIYKGNVTANDIYVLLPLQQTLVTMNLKGSVLKMFLETAIDSHLKLNMPPPCFEISGFNMTIDMTRKSGDRITSIQVKNKDGGYSPMNMNADYTIVTTDYLADKAVAPFLNKISWMGPLANSVKTMLKAYTKYNNLGIKDTEAMIDYVRAQGTIKNITEQRTTIIPATSSGPQNR